MEWLGIPWWVWVFIIPELALTAVWLLVIAPGALVVGGIREWRERREDRRYNNSNPAPAPAPEPYNATAALLTTGPSSREPSTHAEASGSVAPRRSPPRRGMRLAARGATGFLGLVVGLGGVLSGLAYLWVTWVYKVDRTTGRVTDPLGFEVDESLVGAGPGSDLGILSGDLSAHGVAVTLSGTACLVLLFAAAGLINYARGR